MTFYVFGLLALGLVFIVLEVFFPSMGLLGTLAAVSIIGGGVLAYVNDTSGLFLAYLLVGFVLVPLVLFGALKIFPKTPLGRHFTLGGPSFNPKEAQAVEKQLDELVGREGETMTPLRPAGIAVFDRRRVDVVTRGELIDKGVRVKVVKVEGNRVVVEAAAAGRPS